MTNKDKYLKDGVSVYELASELYEFTNDIEEKHKYLKGMIQDFFNTPIPPTLTEDERVILRNINRINYQFIGRRNEFSARLYLAYIDKGEKKIEEEMTFTYAFNQDHLFQFIKERRRIRDKGVIE